MTPLSIAALNAKGSIQAPENYIAILTFLLTKGADPTITSGPEQTTPLHDFIKIINLSFPEGATEKVIDLFLQRGVNVNTPDRVGLTPLHEAARTANLTAATHLIIKGADVKAVSKQNVTPLHLAAAGPLPIINLLINSDADINAKDTMRHSPLDYLKEAIDNASNGSDVSRYLEARCALGSEEMNDENNISEKPTNRHPEAQSPMTRKKLLSKWDRTKRRASTNSIIKAPAKVKGWLKRQSSFS